MIFVVTCKKEDEIKAKYMFVYLFEFRFNVPVNSFSVMSGQY